MTSFEKSPDDQEAPAHPVEQQLPDSAHEFPAPDLVASGVDQVPDIHQLGALLTITESRRRSRNWVIGLWAAVPVALLLVIGLASDDNLDSAIAGAFFGFFLLIGVAIAAVVLSLVHIFRFTSARQNDFSWCAIASIPVFVTAGTLPLFRWTVCRIKDSTCGLDLDRMSWVTERYPDQTAFAFFFDWLPKLLVGLVVIQVILRGVMTFNGWWDKLLLRRVLLALIALAAASYVAILLEVIYLTDLERQSPIAGGSAYFVVGIALMLLSLRRPKASGQPQPAESLQRYPHQ